MCLLCVLGLALTVRLRMDLTSRGGVGGVGVPFVSAV